jgi:hypothetical protein
MAGEEPVETWFAGTVEGGDHTWPCRARRRYSEIASMRSNIRSDGSGNGPARTQRISVPGSEQLRLAIAGAAFGHVLRGSSRHASPGEAMAGICCLLRRQLVRRVHEK